MITPGLATMNTLVAQVARDPGVPSRISFLGYPDLTLEPEAYQSLFGQGALDRLVPRPNAERIRQIHGRPQATIVPTIESVVSLITPLPVEIEILDFQKYVGDEILVDLNEPVPGWMHGRYGVVFDWGTLEHVFDIAQAFINCAVMTAVGGFVVHACPINAMNHGFWNINPTVYADFHEDNGFETALLQLNPWHSAQLGNVPPADRFRLGTHEEVNVFYIGHRRQPQEAFRKPIQRRYRNAEAWR